MNYLLIGLAAAGLLYYNQAKKFIDTYAITFLSSKFDYQATVNSVFTRLFFTVNIEVKNTTEFTGTLESGKINVFLKSTGKNLGFINLPAPVTIKANGGTVVQFPVAIPTVNLYSNVNTLIDQVKTGQAVIFRLQGELKFNVGTLNLDQDYTVKLI